MRVCDIGVSGYLGGGNLRLLFQAPLQQPESAENFQVVSNLYPRVAPPWPQPELPRVETISLGMKVSTYLVQVVGNP